MNGFVMSDEQRMIADSLVRFLLEENSPDQRRARQTAVAPDGSTLWPRLAGLGMIAAAIPSALGGFGGTARDIAVIQYLLGASLAVEPFLASAVVASRILAQWPDEAKRDALIAGLMEGSDLPVLAHIEGFDVFATPNTQVRTDALGLRICGQKSIVDHAGVATAFIVSAVDPDGEIGLYLVAAAAVGVKLDRFRQIDASGAAAICFNDVAAISILRGAAAGRALEDALDWGILGQAAESVGIMQALNRETFSYLGTRKQFGQQLSNFQALQHRSSDMFIAAHEAYVMVDSLIEAFDGGDRRSSAVSAVKTVTDGAGRKVGHEAVQMHGGMGVSDELDVSHYMRRLAAIRAQFGTADLHRLRYRQTRCSTERKLI